MNHQEHLNKVFNNKIIDQKQIDLWNKYLVINPLKDNVYDYFNDILLSIRETPNNPNLPVSEINLCGSRNSGKTHKVITFISDVIALSFIDDFKVKVYCYRYNSSTIPEFRKNIDNILENKGFERKINQSSRGDYFFTNGQNKPVYKFNNGSQIELKGVYNSSNVPLKGTADANCDLVIIICEEANEFSNADFQAIQFAIRGGTKRLTIKMTNPDSQYQHIISYCMKRLRFDRDILSTKGEQFKFIQEQEINKLFHYTNYMTNPYLKEEEVLEMISTKYTDPAKYEIWGIGMPGSTNASIFSRYLDKAESNNIVGFKPIKFIGGVDLGQADTPTGHPTYCILNSFNFRGQYKPLKEFYHNNYEMHHLDPNMLSRAIIDFYIDCANEYPLIKQIGINVYVDGGGGQKTMITLLNNIKMELSNYNNLNWLNIIEVDKEVWSIKDRIDAITIMICNNNLMFDKVLTPKLIEQLDLMKWNEPKNNTDNYKLKPLDKYDDAFDGLCYSMMPVLLETLSNELNRTSLTKQQINKFQSKNTNEWDLQYKGW